MKQTTCKGCGAPREHGRITCGWCTLPHEYEPVEHAKSRMLDAFVRAGGATGVGQPWRVPGQGGQGGCVTVICGGAIMYGGGGGGGSGGCA